MYPRTKAFFLLAKKGKTGEINCGVVYTYNEININKIQACVQT